MTEHHAEATQVDAEATAPEAGDSTDDSQRTDQASEPSTIDSLPDWAKKEIRSLRKEAGTYRTRVKEFEDAQKTEAERQAEALKAAEERATQFEQRFRDANARTAVTDAATKAGAVAPSLIYRAVRDDLQFDDDGNATNIAEVLDALKASEPQVFRAAGGSGDGGQGGQGPQTLDLNAAIRQQLGAS